MVNINGEGWRITLASRNHPALQRSDGSFTLGSCDDVLKTIYIRENLNDEYFKKVLCHELTHAAMFSYNIDLNYDQEELLADLFATYGEEIVEITNKIFCRMNGKKIKGTCC